MYQCNSISSWLCVNFAICVEKVFSIYGVDWNNSLDSTDFLKLINFSSFRVHQGKSMLNEINLHINFAWLNNEVVIRLFLG